ncbi:MAG: uracil-DNA glycosylase [Verrucomicrobia bacterium]|nr:uracil-DNA glycosylase [Verrucomicrobiota bacterium]
MGVAGGFHSLSLGQAVCRFGICPGGRPSSENFPLDGAIFLPDFRIKKRVSLETLSALEREIIVCRKCPRLVKWREKVAREKKAAYAKETYWGRPVPGWGDPRAKIVVVGLAPGAHGANRTGRMFTGDESGRWLYRALWKAGWASQAQSTGRRDGLKLKEVWITSPVKCAPPTNRPTPGERDACAGFFQRELSLLREGRVYVALGGFGFEAVARFFGLRPKPKFAHGVEVELPGGRWLVGSYHVSQQNTFTGRLTEPMLDGVMQKAAKRAGLLR